MNQGYVTLIVSNYDDIGGSFKIRIVWKNMEQLGIKDPRELDLTLSRSPSRGLVLVDRRAVNSVRRKET